MIEGVIRTRVGYAGGLMKNPNYGHMGDHTETVQVDFDPKQITYESLLEVFWDAHKPSQHWYSRQYMNAIFFHDEEQQKLAFASKIVVERKSGTVRTEVLPLRSFTLAEDYHQKYYLQQQPDLLKEMLQIYPRHADFVNSTAVARLNGYVGGSGSKAQLSKEIDRLGLSPKARKALESRVLIKGWGLLN